MTAPLTGRVAVITGGSRGIGAATAGALAERGAAVVVSGRDGDRLQAVVKDLEGRGVSALGVVADVARREDADRLVDATKERFGRIDVLVNNAGMIRDGLLVRMRDEDWDRVMEVNLKGVFLGCKHAIPALLRAGGGSIVNTASFVALMGAATSQIAYTASKGGVLAMTREIAVEYARRGIRANALCPGPVNTPLLQDLLADPAARARRLVHVPMGRLAEAGEVARAALFLASDDASYVNGATFLVDGGITAAYVTPES